jgi:hypothetical protein
VQDEMEKILVIPASGLAYLMSVPEYELLTTLQSIVRGYIEIIPHFTRVSWDGQQYNCVAFRNEQYKLHKDLPQQAPVNVLAYRLWKQSAGLNPVDELLSGDIPVVLRPKGWKG